jgi:Glycosyltransferases involved in cell wall biogenesis
MKRRKFKMGNYQYKVSIIVPVYNVSEYLRECLDSLLAQSMNKTEMEILLINDGSTDDSLEICKEYAEEHKVFKVFSKENEGLSATRNFGIKCAKGKYMMYIDSDDMFAPNTVEAVTTFFDKHYDEVDLVTYLDQPYKFGKKMQVHYRYQYIKKSGVYSLQDFPYISQTRVNICVKNRIGNNPLFDTTPGFRLEDQEYCSKVLRDKLKIGFCEDGEYLYNRSNDSSIVANYFYAYYIFESSLAYFERLFQEFDGDVSKYYQAMYLNDLIWKHNENKLYPYHYDNEKFEHAMARIIQLLNRVDSDVIVNHPKLDNFQKQYWLKLKSNAAPMIVADVNGAKLYVDGKAIYQREKFELIMHKVRINKKQMRFLAFVKSPIYTHLEEKANIYVVENDDLKNKRLLDVFESVHSYYKSETKTCTFYAFSYRCDTTKINRFKFLIELDGYYYDTTFWCMPVAVFKNSMDSYVRDDVKITLTDNELFLTQMEKEDVLEFELEQTEKFIKNEMVYTLRTDCLMYRQEHRVWLYYDLYTVKKDNGYYQFVNDIKHNDGIERYYIYDRDLSEIETLFLTTHKIQLVKFGSTIHKVLYLSAEKILTAYYGFSTISPFATEDKEKDYLDIIKFEVIYLQHGVLHANFITKNHVERCRSEKIVISSHFEKENLMSNYAYEEDDLICTGMSRYDYIDKHKESENRILFAPSWRSYLTFAQTASKWEVQTKKIKSSDYYKGFMNFLESKELHDLLEKNDLHIDFKLHPIIQSADDLFQIENSRIHIVVEDVIIENYKIFITDFSSYTFDYAYLNRPVIYFVPDYEQFKSGMHHYRELDLPFDKAFGNLCLNAEDTTTELEKIIKNQFEPEKLFADRMKNFYFDFENCAESLYQYLINE